MLQRHHYYWHVLQKFTFHINHLFSLVLNRCHFVYIIFGVSLCEGEITLRPLTYHPSLSIEVLLIFFSYKILFLQ